MRYDIESRIIEKHLFPTGCCRAGVLGDISITHKNVQPARAPNKDEIESVAMYLGNEVEDYPQILIQEIELNGFEAGDAQD